MNLYLLIAGIFLIFLSIVHAVFGELTVFQPIFQSNLNSLLKISVYVPWHQLTLVLLLSGISQVIAAFRQKQRTISTFILAIVVGNLSVFLGISIIESNWAVLENSIPQYVLFAIILVFMILGIRKHRLEGKVTESR